MKTSISHSHKRVQSIICVLIALCTGIFVFTYNTPVSTSGVCHWGGQAKKVFNGCRQPVGAKHIIIGPPGGVEGCGFKYLETPATKNYDYGPQDSGEWGLGRAGNMNICWIKCGKSNCPYDVGRVKIFQGTSL